MKNLPVFINSRFNGDLRINFAKLTISIFSGIYSIITRKIIKKSRSISHLVFTVTLIHND